MPEFNLYVGFDPDYRNNALCPGGPFAKKDDYFRTFIQNNASTGTNYSNGGEAWCNLEGMYVSYVKEAGVSNE